MISYLIHTGVSSNSQIGWMGIVSNSGTRHHSNTCVITCHPTLTFGMQRNETRTALFGPVMFKIGLSGVNSVGVSVHVGKVSGE